MFNRSTRVLYCCLVLMNRGGFLFFVCSAAEHREYIYPLARRPLETQNVFVYNMLRIGTYTTYFVVKWATLVLSHISTSV